MRTENNMQAVDSWCAWRTLQTWLFLNAMIPRIKGYNLTDCYKDHNKGYLLACLRLCESNYSVYGRTLNGRTLAGNHGILADKPVSWIFAVSRKKWNSDYEQDFKEISGCLCDLHACRV